MNVVEHAVPTVPSARPNADDWFEKGYTLENDNAEAACKAYERAIAADPTHRSAHVNLGRLLHEAGRLEQAEHLYRRALVAAGDDALLWYNLGVLLTDRDNKHEALQAYERALRLNPRMADCHYNMALLYEALKKPKQALRYMAQYRKLVHKP
jgi:tetratricopeptide (TPR) repeat protein